MDSGTTTLKAAQRIEERKRAADHADWLRDERVKAYANLSTGSEEAFQLVRSEFVKLPENRAEIETRWSELRKAHNQVALLGTEEPRRRGKELWKAARNGANDVFAGDRFLEACRADVQGAR